MLGETTRPGVFEVMRCASRPRHTFAAHSEQQPAASVARPGAPGRFAPSVSMLGDSVHVPVGDGGPGDGGGGVGRGGSGGAGPGGGLCRTMAAAGSWVRPLLPSPAKKSQQPLWFTATVQFDICGMRMQQSYFSSPPHSVFNGVPPGPAHADFSRF